jgi:hypothetical protein
MSDKLGIIGRYRQKLAGLHTICWVFSLPRLTKNLKKMSDNFGRPENRQKPKELNFVGIPLWNLKSVSGDLIKSASILPKNITRSVMSLSETL